MSFSDAFKDETNETLTQNRGLVYSTTGNSLLDLFSRIGGMRDASSEELSRMYLDARKEDKELADNLILYVRDIRQGGLGERRIARELLKTMALKDPSKVLRNFDTIVNTGRWDDLFVLEGTAIETEMLEFLRAQFKEDMLNMYKDKPISLLAKWLPSCNTSSAETRRLARKIYTFFGINERTYRKSLSLLRKYIDIVERKMSVKQFSTINYETVPSLAMTRYRNSFRRNDEERFNEYLIAVSNGEKKINSSTCYPYELIRPYILLFNGMANYIDSSQYNDEVLEEQWKALPNYVEGNHNVIVMADVSGSMTIDNYRPLAASTSLAIYFAERNKGSYKNLIMTFTDCPSLYEINPNDTLLTKAIAVNSHIGFNTNLDVALLKIFELSLKAKESPEALVIISDGEIDEYCRRNDVGGIVEKWEEEFNDNHLTFPKIIMWNAASYGNRYIAKKSNKNVSYISGCSAATFNELTTLIQEDAVEAMIKILSKPQFCWK